MATTYVITVTLDEDDPSEVLDTVIEWSGDEDAAVALADEQADAQMVRDNEDRMVPANDRTAMSLIIDGLIAGGVTLVNVWDGEEHTDLAPADKAAALDAITAVDEAYLNVTRPDGRDGWIRFVLGNEPIEVVCDHTVNLAEFIDPTTDAWWK